MKKVLSHDHTDAGALDFKVDTEEMYMVGIDELTSLIFYACQMTNEYDDLEFIADRVIEKFLAKDK